MNVAFVGCGYVADFYAKTLDSHPGLRLAGAHDRNPARSAALAQRWHARAFGRLEELLADPSIELVLNLTNPREHAAVTRACLEAGKHVYSEKPLAMTVAEAEDLVRLARARGLRLASAPCSVLGQAAQTLWHAVREGAVGQVRLVYASIEDGMIAPAMQPWNWANDLGAPWPAKDEFETGCTLEHAGYALTWLAAMFGPAQRVTAFASTQVPDKGIAVDGMAPDFSVGCVEYAGGVVARVTCGMAAPREKSITVIGDHGTLFVGNVRDDFAPVRLRPTKQAASRAGIDRRLGWLHRALESRTAWPGVGVLFQETWKAGIEVGGARATPGKPVDFLRGPAEMADAIAKNRPCRLSPELGVHVLELSLALQHPDPDTARRAIGSTFEPIEPLPARGHS